MEHAGGELILTKPQRRALEQAVGDGGEIVMRGADKTDNCPTRGVVRRLVDMGLLALAVPPTMSLDMGDYYRITPAGMEALILTGSAEKTCGNLRTV